ncbi:MAG TPA: catalase, partial [Acidimicrobiia bacterium]|nr:catalase [Acidimicrobiia bacterium]
NMSDRGIPRSYRMMEGFGVHTFRLVNEAGDSTLVKFHWKPALGVHSLIWEESQKLMGIDPDFHRRDLWDAIASGTFPEYELGIQIFDGAEDDYYNGIDLLDPTKIVPEEMVPVRRIGRMTLDRNPDNFFAETEQVAFCTANVVRGIDFTDDPLLAARNFSYLDTQLTRLGGPNFNQLPINRPLSDVDTTQRDGFGQHAVPEGRAPYNPNSLQGGCPMTADGGGFVHFPEMVQGEKVRERPVGGAQKLSFDDHYTQATLFWRSMTPVEQDHIVGAFSFELGKVETIDVKDRMLAGLANVDAALTARVAANLGRPVPQGKPVDEVETSAALSMVAQPLPGPIAGRMVGVLVGQGADAAGIKTLRAAFEAEGATLVVIGPHGGELSPAKGQRAKVPVDKSIDTTQSVEYDALILADGDGDMTANPLVAVNLEEAFRHAKTIAAWGRGRGGLDGLRLDPSAPGVITAETGDEAFAAAVVEAVGRHRHWDRPQP